MSTHFLKDLSDGMFKSEPIYLSTNKFIIGSDIEINDGSVLSQHAVLTKESDGWTCHALSVLNSGIGARVYVNGNELVRFGVVRMEDGDVISLANRKFMFRKRKETATKRYGATGDADEEYSSDIEKEQALKRYFCDLESENEALLLKRDEMDKLIQSYRYKIADLERELEELKQENQQTFPKTLINEELKSESLEFALKNCRTEAETEKSKLTLSLWSKEEEIYDLTIRNSELQMLILKLENGSESLLNKINYLQSNSEWIKRENLSVKTSYAELRLRFSSLQESVEVLQSKNLYLQNIYKKVIAEKNVELTNVQAREFVIESLKAQIDDTHQKSTVTQPLCNIPATIATPTELFLTLRKANMREKSQTLETKYKELFQQYSQELRKIQDLEREKSIMYTTSATRKEKLKTCNEKLTVALKDLDKITLEKTQKDAEIGHKYFEISQKDAEISKKDAEISEKDAEISEKDAEISKKDAEISKKDAEISKKDAKISKKDAEISKKDAEISKKDAEISKKDTNISKKDVEIALKNGNISRKDAEISLKDLEIALKQERILTLQDSVRPKHFVYHSNSGETVTENGASSLSYDSLKTSYNNIFKELAKALDQIKQMESAHGEQLSIETANRLEITDQLKEKEAEIVSLYQLLQNLQSTNHKKFLKHMESELSCAICSEMLRDAVSLNCSHTFCHDCIENWKRNKNDCPTCRAYISHEVSAGAINRFIDKAMEDIQEEQHFA